jgi:hypothetical protein
MLPRSEWSTPMNDIIHGRDDCDAAGGRKVGRKLTSQLHHTVYLVAAALAIWLVLSVWLFASGSGVTDYLLFIVSGFILVVVSLIVILSRVGGKASKSESDEPPLREWTRSDFDLDQGHLSSKQAATQILLPIAAVAFGMTLFGVVLLVVERMTA